MIVDDLDAVAATGGVTLDRLGRAALEWAEREGVDPSALLRLPDALDRSLARAVIEAIGLEAAQAIADALACRGHTAATVRLSASAWATRVEIIVAAHRLGNGRLR